MPTTVYSPEEVAEALDRHPESIRRNCRKGQLDGTKWSGEWVISKEALEEWLPAPVYRDAFGGEVES